MRRILAGLALALLIASPVLAKGGASITAGAGPYAFGQTVATFDVVASFEPKNGRTPDGGYWARVECSRGGSPVYAQYADLTPPLYQSGFTFGPTFLWTAGGVDCVVRLVSIDGRGFTEYATDEFIVGP